MNRRFFVLSILILFQMVWAVDVYLQTDHGVPHIMVDGKAVRQRWFWGNQATDQLKLKPGWQEVSASYLPRLTGVHNITFHLRFPHKPNEFLLASYEVFDETAGQPLVPCYDFTGQTGSIPQGWVAWPTDPQKNTVGFTQLVEKATPEGRTAWRITLKNPSDGGAWPDFHLYTKPTKMELTAGHIYTIRFRIWAKETSSVIPGAYEPAHPSYMAAFHSEYLHKDTIFMQQIRLAHDVGVNFVTTIVPLPWAQAGMETDWGKVDGVMDEVLAANPEALIIPRIRLDAPRWWIDAHPDDIVGWQEPKYGHATTASVCSQAWLHDSLSNLRKCIAHLEERYPGRIAGYHPCNLNTWEWFYQDSWREDYHGYSPVEINGFREWLKRKYQTDQTLQVAWHDPDVILDTVLPPTVEERRSAKSIAGFLLPEAAQKVIDHNLFLQDAIADAILTTARTVREATPERRLVVFFYGYICEFANMNRMSACGHLAMNRLLDSPDIDILCSPISYHDRLDGGSGSSMTCAESVLLHDKLWFYEDDTRTYLAADGNLAGLNDYVKTPHASHDVLLRNNAQEVIRNLGCWWMDLAAIGWYNDPMLWTANSALAGMEQSKLAQPHLYEPPIAWVLDEHSAIYTKDARRITAPSIYELRAKLARCGAPFGQYYLDDLLNGLVKSHLVIMGNMQVCHEITRLKEILADRFVLWVHAPGIIHPNFGCDLARSAELTGFQLSSLGNKEQKAVLKTTELGRHYGLPETWNVAAFETEVFAVTEQPGDEVLARWSNGTAAVIHRDNAIFSASPDLPSELFTLAAYFAGVHLYSIDNCVLYTYGEYLMVHGTHDGPVTLRFPTPTHVKNVVTGKMVVAGAVPEWHLTLKKGQTLVLQLDK